MNNRRRTWFKSRIGVVIADFQTSSSFRKINPAYSGACVRVRRSSDSTEQDIGFASGVLDESALLSFVGAGDGFVRTWYDQFGSAHFAQTTAANQPKLVSSGVIEKYLGYVCILSSTTDRLDSPSNTFLRGGPALSYSSQIHYVSRLTKTGSSILFVAGGSQFGLVSQSGSSNTAIYQSYAVTANANPDENYIAYVNGVQSSPYTNRGAVYTKHAGFNIISESNCGFGVASTARLGGYGSGFDFEDRVFEVNSYVRANTDFSDRSEIVTVQDSMNSFYNIY